VLKAGKANLIIELMAFSFEHSEKILKNDLTLFALCLLPCPYDKKLKFNSALT
jgi:hypothetical protein